MQNLRNPCHRGPKGKVTVVWSSLGSLGKAPDLEAKDPTVSLLAPHWLCDLGPGPQPL
jgi:hypothetical protein